MEVYRDTLEKKGSGFFFKLSALPRVLPIVELIYIISKSLTIRFCYVPFYLKINCSYIAMKNASSLEKI